jgi:hypothetical protein
MGRIRCSAKAFSVDIYERSDGRYHAVSKDKTGESHYITRRSLSDATKLQSEKIAELVSCPRNTRYFVAIKMGRRQGARRERVSIDT